VEEAKAALEKARPRPLHANHAGTATVDVEGISPSQSSSELKYNQLRFYDSCTEYLRYSSNKSGIWTSHVARILMNATRYHSHEDLFLAQLFDTDFRWQLASEGIQLGTSSACGHNSSTGCSEAGNGKKGKRPSTKHRLVHTSTVVSDLYEACQIDALAYRRFDRFCSPFSGSHKNHTGKTGPSFFSLMRKQELIHDIADYYRKGPGGDSIVYTMSCLLIEDILRVIFDVIQSPEQAPIMNLRFAHAETLMPFIALLDLYPETSKSSVQGNAALSVLEQHYLQQLEAGTSNLLNTSVNQGNSHPTTDAQFLFDNLPLLKHSLSGSRLSPMAANIQLQLLDCGISQSERFWVRMLHNEQPIDLPPCNPLRHVGRVMVGPQYACPLSQFAHHYRAVVYPQYGLGQCNYIEWVKHCNGTTIPSCASASSHT
jgi:hypothetical protein